MMREICCVAQFYIDVYMCTRFFSVVILHILLDESFEMVTFVIIIHIKESWSDWNETSSLHKNTNAHETNKQTNKKFKRTH